MLHNRPEPDAVKATLGGGRVLAACFIAAVLALVAAGAGVYHSTLRLLAAADSTEQAQARMGQLSAVQDAVIDAETGSRGYVITGDPAFLEPYQRGNAAVKQELDALEALYRDNPARGTLLAQLRAQVNDRLAHVDATVLLRRDGDFAAAQALVAGGRGRTLTDSIRTLITAIVVDEQEALRLGQEAVVRATRSATRRIAGEGALAVVLLAGAFLALRRESHRRHAAANEVLALNQSLAIEVDQIREDLQASERRLHNALDGLLEGCAIIDFNCRYRYVNRAMAEHGRSTVDQMIGRTLMEVYPGFESTAVYATLQRTLTERSTQQVDLEFTFPDGASGWFRLHVEPVTEGAFVLSVEITERIHAQQSLESSEARHRALLSGLPDLVFLLDGQGVVVDFHAPNHTTLLAPPSELVGRPLTATLPPEQASEIGAALGRVTQTGHAETLSYDLEFPDGKRYFEATLVPTDGNRVTTVVRDITARHNLEDQLRQAQKMEAVGQLTGGIAHDFNNVLTIIGSNAELLALHASPGSEAPEELEEILRATRRGADMISRLLTFSRRSTRQRHAVDPAAVVAEMAGMLERLLPAFVRLEVGTLETGSTVRLDSGALEQVLANLCTNARDAMPDGGTIRIECEATWLDAGYHATHPWVKPGPFACISLSDTGSGMDEATRARVFEPFFTTKALGVGTGLGMAMVYGMMKDHDGMVHVYSEPGRGTVIKLYFPLATNIVPDQPKGQRDDARSVAGGGETLVLAEDDVSIRLATRRALESKGYRVLEAADGEQALALFRQHRHEIRLLVSDLVMPNLGGQQLAEAL